MKKIIALFVTVSVCAMVYAAQTTNPPFVISLSGASSANRVSVIGDRIQFSGTNFGTSGTDRAISPGGDHGFWFGTNTYLSGSGQLFLYGGDLYSNTRLNVKTNLTVSGNVNVSGSLTTTNDVTVHGILAVDGSVFSSGAALNAFSGPAVFSGNPTVLSKGFVQTSNAYPISSWSATLGSFGCITWLSNGYALYLICTNAALGQAVTNKIGGF